MWTTLATNLLSAAVTHLGNKSAPNDCHHPSCRSSNFSQVPSNGPPTCQNCNKSPSSEEDNNRRGQKNASKKQNVQDRSKMLNIVVPCDGSFKINIKKIEPGSFTQNAQQGGSNNTLKQNSYKQKQPNTNQNWQNGYPNQGENQNQQRRNQKQYSGNQNQQNGNPNFQKRNQNQHNSNQNQQRRNQNQHGGNQNQQKGNQNQYSGNQNQQRGNQNQHAGNQNQTVNQNHYKGNQNQYGGNQNQQKGIQYQPSGNQNQQRGNQRQQSGNQNQIGCQNQQNKKGNQNQQTICPHQQKMNQIQHILNKKPNGNRATYTESTPNVVMCGQRTWMYLGRLKADTTEFSISNYLYQKFPGYQFTVVALPLYKDAKLPCFKVYVDNRILDDFQNVENWPTGVKILKFKENFRS